MVVGAWNLEIWEFVFSFGLSYTTPERPSVEWTHNSCSEHITLVTRSAKVVHPLHSLLDCEALLSITHALVISLRAHITVPLCKLHWYPLRFQVQFRVLVIITFKALHGTGPGILRNHLTPMLLVWPTWSSRRGMLWTPLIKEFQLMRSRRRVFSAVAPAFWNILHFEVRSICTFFGLLEGCLNLGLQVGLGSREGCYRLEMAGGSAGKILPPYQSCLLLLVSVSNVL